MAANMNLIVKSCFPRAKRVTDRFHVQKLAYEAVQNIRIKHRWETLDAENIAYKKAKEKGIEYQPEVLANGDTRKQLLARSRICYLNQKKNGPSRNGIEHIYYLNSILILRKPTSYLIVFTKSITVKYRLMWPEQNWLNGSTR